MRQNLHPEKLQVSLDTFIQKMKLANRADNPKLVSKIVMKWTQGQTLLTKNLLQYILQSDLRINEGEEGTAVEKVIRNRLLKEFKTDDLTLEIRQKLYQKDLENLLELKGSKIDKEDFSYLLKIQQSLELTDKQIEAINNKKLGLSNYFYLNPNSHFISYKNDLNQLSVDTGFSSISLESPEICEQSDLIAQSLSKSEIILPAKKSFNKKWLLLLLSTPLLFLSFKGVNWIRKNQLITSNNPNLEQQKLCVDLASRQSPRMSLGEKLLTKDYSQLNPAGLVASYEGMAAFARCEFLSAQNKYQQSLAIDKNNPEALIYQNNAAAIASPHFKIAVSIPLGSKPDIAWEILRGVAQAQTEVNQEGGINHKLLLVQIVNDDNDPYVVEQLAQELAADRSIMAIIGHNDSNSSLAGAKIYEQEKLVMISPTSTSTKLSGKGDYILRTIPSVSALAAKLANYAAAKSLTKIAICADSQDSASNSFAQEFRAQNEVNGGQIAEINCDFAQPEFQPDSSIKQATAQNADALLLVPSVNKMNQAIAIAQANQQQLPLLGNHSLYTYKTLQSGQNAIAGMVIPSPWLSDDTHHSNFSQMAMQYWGGEVNWRTAMAYDATEAIINGLKTSENRTELQATLTQPSFFVDGATGKFKFEQGDRQGQVQLAYIKPTNQSNNQYQFAKLEM